MIALVFALEFACVPMERDGEDVPDTAETDTDVPEDTSAQAEDDARVRALTGLPEGDSACAAPILGRVEDRTVDGDTFYLHPEDGGASIKVRVIGVDTPETAHDDPAECYGDEAWDWATEQLGGRLVWLTFDAECLDYYDRSLAYVFRGEDEAGFFNRALARNGYATPLTIAPNDTFEDAIAADALAARNAGLGLWAACDR